MLPASNGTRFLSPGILDDLLETISVLNSPHAIENAADALRGCFKTVGQAASLPWKDFLSAREWQAGSSPYDGRCSFETASHKNGILGRRLKGKA
jgi:hypothetical protein